MTATAISISQSTSTSASSHELDSFSSLKKVIAKIEVAVNEWENYVEDLGRNQWLSFSRPHILEELNEYQGELTKLPNDALVVRERGFAMIRKLRSEVEERGVESSPLLDDSFGDPDHAINKQDHQILKNFPEMRALRERAMQSK